MPPNCATCKTTRNHIYVNYLLLGPPRISPFSSYPSSPAPPQEPRSPHYAYPPYAFHDTIRSVIVFPLRITPSETVPDDANTQIASLPRIRHLTLSTLTHISPIYRIRTIVITTPINGRRFPMRQQRPTRSKPPLDPSLRHPKSITACLYSHSPDFRRHIRCPHDPRQ